MRKIEFIDSHTGGEPTRLIMAGGPDLGSGPLAERVSRFKKDYEDWRTGMVGAPRGTEVTVGALLCEPVDRSCVAGVIFFNNIGYLGMCGHGTIGLINTLAYTGAIKPGVHRVETPVGIVKTELYDDGRVSVQNVNSYRHAAGVKVNVAGRGVVTGDVAWGGNWFFLVHDCGIPLVLENIPQLIAFSTETSQALNAQGVTGANGARVTHIELVGASPRSGINSRSFVLFPDGRQGWDRSACGTGTSAKLACLAADKRLGEGELWRNENIICSTFEAFYQRDPQRAGEQIIPTIIGRAHMMAEGHLCFDPSDPWVAGCRP
jgi:4-hydroxyproline epimerase